MITFRSLTALQRVVYHAQDFNKCCVRGDLRNVYRAFNKNAGLEDDDKATTVKKPRPKTVPIPKITLLSPNDSITVTVLEDAQRLAKRRKLNLVKISDLDSKTKRPVYKLISSSAFLEKTEQEIKNDDKQKSKHIKLLYVSAKIAENDMLTKAKSVVKLLSKGHKVKIVITLDGSNEAKTQSIIEDAVKNYGSIQRMPSRKNVVILLINPVLNQNNSVDNKEVTGTINQGDNV